MVLVLLLAGCGGKGGGSSSATPVVGKGKGRAVLTVKWPARTSARLIPLSSNAVVVNLLQGTTVVASQALARPTDGETTSSATLTGLAFGSYSVSARAFESTDGSGVAQASGTGSITVTEDTPGALTVSLVSTVARLSVAPSTVGTGSTASVVASAQDADGAIVPIGSEALAWTTDDAGIAAVEGTGVTAVLTGVVKGSTTIHVSMVVDDAGDRVAGDGTVAVKETGTLSISPNGGNVVLTYKVTYAGLDIERKPIYNFSLKSVSPSSIDFAASLGGRLAGTEVKWSDNVFAAPGGATAHYSSSHGVFAPPRTQPRPPQGDTITTTSVVDPSISATVSVSYSIAFE